VISNQRPRMHFNSEGICGQCLYSDYKNSIVDWEKREKELQDLCDRYRSDDGSWDVIVPGSGGKDSGYTTYILKEKFGMHPLTVTWASAIPTDIGSQNLYNFIQSGFDNITVSPNGTVHRKLSKFSFVEYGENFLPFSYGQIHVPLHIAVKFNIPFVMDGEYPKLYEKEFLDYMEMDKETLCKTIDKFRRSLIWEQENNQWKLRQQVTKL